MILNSGPLRATHNEAIKRPWHRVLIKRAVVIGPKQKLFLVKRDFLSRPEIRVKTSAKIDWWKRSEFLMRLWQDRWEATGRIGEGQYLHQRQISPTPICYERKRMSKENELTVTYKSRHRRFRD